MAEVVSLPEACLYGDGRLEVHGADSSAKLESRVVVITGSFNFTKAAETNNAENLLVIRSTDMAKVYAENWEEHKGHSERYEGRN